MRMRKRFSEDCVGGVLTGLRGFFAVIFAPANNDEPSDSNSVPDNYKRCKYDRSNRCCNTKET